MFDLRYHVASLAAVFVALLIGILVGVGLTGKVDDAEKNELRRIIQVQEEELRVAREREGNATREDDALAALVEHGAPKLMEGRLRGQRIGLLFVGSPDAEIGASISTALEDAGARDLTRMRALKVPIDPDKIESELQSRPALARLGGEDRLRELGRVLAQEFVLGGDAPTWNALSTELVVGQRGRFSPPLDGVIVCRTAEPQQEVTAPFLSGLYVGLADAVAPAVGVETTGANPSAVDVFDRADLATVDNVETPPGRLAMALLLAGAEPGNYGVKDTASRPLPDEFLEGG
jgi:hypothetical protein